MIKMTGEAFKFEGGVRNGLQSNEFRSWHPKSFVFQAAGAAEHCQDLRGGIMGYVLVILFLGVAFLQLHPPALFAYMLLLGWMYVTLGADPVSPSQPEISLVSRDPVQFLNMI